MPNATDPVAQLEDHEVSLVAHAMATVLQQIHATAAQATRDRHPDVFADALPFAMVDPMEAVAQPLGASQFVRRRLRRLKRDAMTIRVRRYYPVLCMEAPRFFTPTTAAFTAFVEGAMHSFEALLLRAGQLKSVENLQDLDDPALAPQIDTLVLNAPKGVDASRPDVREGVLGAKRTPNMEDLIDDLGDQGAGVTYH